MIIKTLCKTTDRSEKKRLRGEWRGKKQMNTADVFLATRYGSAKLNEFQVSITSAQISKS